MYHPLNKPFFAHTRTAIEVLETELRDGSIKEQANSVRHSTNIIDGHNCFPTSFDKYVDDWSALICWWHLIFSSLAYGMNKFESCRCPRFHDLSFWKYYV